MTEVDLIVTLNLLIGGINLWNAVENNRNSKTFIADMIKLRKIAANMHDHIDEHLSGTDAVVNPHRSAK